MTSRRRHAVTKVPLEAKKLGVDKFKTFKAGTECHIDRNGSNPGEFILWFVLRFYAKVDAVNLQDTVFMLEE